MRTIQYIFLYTIKSLLLILQNFTKEEKGKKERKSGKIVAKADFCCQRGTLDSAKGKSKNKTLPCIKLPGCPHNLILMFYIISKGGCGGLENSLYTKPP